LWDTIHFIENNRLGEDWQKFKNRSIKLRTELTRIINSAWDSLQTFNHSEAQDAKNSWWFITTNLMMILDFINHNKFDAAQTKTKRIEMICREFTSIRYGNGLS